MKTFLSFLILAAITVAVVAQAQYNCGVTYTFYNLDTAPATLGLSAGEYVTGKKAFVGLGSQQANALTAGRLTTNPAGITLPTADGGVFNNCSVWYLAPKSTQTYTWVSSQNGDLVPFAVDYGSNSSGTPYYFGRVTKNNLVMLGVVRLFLGSMIYVNENGNLTEIESGYEVLTCKSTVAEDPVQPPTLVVPAANNDIGCIPNWIQYNNDVEPATNGVSAGAYENSKFAYIGKGSPGCLYCPGTIKVNDTIGFYTLRKDTQVQLQNASYYLAKNESYSYGWKTFTGSLPSNAVMVRNKVANLAFGIVRQKFNGRVRIGNFLSQTAYFPNSDDTSTKFSNYFEVLVCDPVPKYKCSQTWKTYNNDGAPSVDGLVAGTRKNITSYVGRGSLGCVNCDYNIGRIEITSTNNSGAGAYYAGDISENEIYDNITAQYLVNGAGNTYVWKGSSDGNQVKNAVGSTAGQSEYYIGMTVVDHQVLVGKVHSSEGLYYTNVNGTRALTNTYAVLTCFSTNPNNGV